jgi:DNA-directed RNA polymerase specialized sigma subunit
LDDADEVQPAITSPARRTGGRRMPSSFRGLCWAMMPGNSARFLGPEKEKALVLHYQRNGCSHTAHRIVEAFSGWLISRAVDVLGQEAVAAGDGFADAVCALLDAAERWDVDAGNRLASYATPYVMGALLRLTMIKGPLTIGTSSDERKAFFGHRRAKKAFADTHGRWPTARDGAELAGIIGCSEEVFHRVTAWKSARIVEIDADLEEPPKASSAERAVLERTLVGAVAAVRANALPRDKAILDASVAQALLGSVSDGDNPALADLAQRFGCTPRRVRQIRANLFGAIRAHLAAKGIMGVHDALGA